ncbi:hypothetical protein K493DRAFT_89452 [Basidiobolus meristosporus CBS 931.73]|uniref:DH domain-containing protein n=1 Tax=Basidiobolus meristosporus CBS 931.73 TaxID=1314790 RepID=A0A1Y1XCD3_9FUNG|nr:hypothetical protein K493DRAFT_89452 [Basidiobolus meristosporus CBS 931.73]|eukprot:ORX83398.1 hypothetical protein K493DRAFT_89452 [Basidiobolus meristosporus CBS 931.73]
MSTRCPEELSIDTNFHHMEAAPSDSIETPLYTSPRSSMSLDDPEGDSLISAKVEKLFMELFQSDLSAFRDNEELKFGPFVSGVCGHRDYFDMGIIPRNGHVQDTFEEKSENNGPGFTRSNSRYSLRGLQLFKTIKKATPSLSRSSTNSVKPVEDTFVEPEEVGCEQPLDTVCQRANPGTDGTHEQEQGNSNNDSSNKFPSQSPKRNLTRFNSLTTLATNNSVSGESQNESASGSSFSSSARVLKPSLSLSARSRKSLASFRSFTNFTSEQKLSRKSSQRSQASDKSTSSRSSGTPEPDKAKSMEITRSRGFIPLDIPKNLGDFSATSILNELGIEEKEVKRSQSLNSPLKPPEVRFLRKNSSSVDLSLISWAQAEACKTATHPTQREFNFSKQMSQLIRPHCHEIRYFVTEEIFTTEISYMENLEIILNVCCSCCFM